MSDIVEVDATDPRIGQLLDAQREELVARYSEDVVISADQESLRGAPLYAFQDGDALVSCGALLKVDDSTAEIVRMYTVPERRASGLARVILNTLMKRAQRDGYQRVVLELGAFQEDALRMYESAGFTQTDAFGPYVGDADAMVFEYRF